MLSPIDISDNVSAKTFAIKI